VASETRASWRLTTIVALRRSCQAEVAGGGWRAPCCGVARSGAQVALAWLLHRSPTIVLIPGTSSIAHVRENVAAAAIELPADAVERLDAIGA
jgi:hypothetical protein